MKTNKYIVFSAIGFELLGIIAATVFIGQQLDTRFGLNGLGIVGCSMLGLAGWIYHVIVLSRQLDTSSDKNDS